MKKFKKWFDEVNKFKIELEKDERFSPREKEKMFYKGIGKIPFEQEEITSHKKHIISVPDEKGNTIDLPDSFASLINRAKSNQHSDHVMLATYHLIIQKNYESVSVKDIVEEYKKAYLKPSNTNVYLANLSRRGLLMPTEKKEGKAAFTITRDGIKYVEELLSNDGE